MPCHAFSPGRGTQRSSRSAICWLAGRRPGASVWSSTGLGWRSPPEPGEELNALRVSSAAVPPGVGAPLAVLGEFCALALVDRGALRVGHKGPPPVHLELLLAGAVVRDLHPVVIVLSEGGLLVE